MRNQFSKWLSAAALLLVVAATPAWAAYPDKPVKIIVGFAPGGGNDIIARLVAKELTLIWGQPVVVENRPGANGAIGMQAVAKAPADGYTLALATAGPSTMSAALNKLPFDVIKDFTPIINIVDGVQALAVNAKVPVTNVREFVNLAKQTSPPMSYSSPGIGNSGHYAMEMLKQMGKFELTHVAYKGAAPALNDLIAGHVQAYFTSIAALLPHIESGTVKVLAVTSKERLPSLPNVPTMAQAGLPEFDCPVFGGLLGPAGMSAAIVQKINSDANQALQSVSLRESLLMNGLIPVGGTVQEFVRFLPYDLERWKTVVRKGNIKPE
ncbi:MAG: tripartite tricarboxylate transporter substrate binding protein [Chthoniobacteraceae bacterium]|nr:tripartite tricarboxylate transporter substrate binding protein [Chthoniobacteraceae bacterium]